MLKEGGTQRAEMLKIRAKGQAEMLALVESNHVKKSLACGLWGKVNIWVGPIE
jgi:hypothetical protein